MWYLLHGLREYFTGGVARPVGEMGDLPEREPNQESTDAVERAYRRNAAIGIVLGMVCQVAGPIISGDYPWLGRGMVLAGTALFVWGSYCEAKRKGYHGLVGLLGLGSCIGVFFLCSLPDKVRDDPASEKSTLARYQSKAVLAIGLALISPIVMGLLLSRLVSQTWIEELEGYLVFSVAYLLIVVGGYYLVKRKGRHTAWTVAALLFLPGLWFLFILPDRFRRDYPDLNSSLRTFQRVMVAVTLFAAMCIAIEIPMYVSYKRTGCDRAASQDLEALRTPLKKFNEERVQFNCPPGKLPPNILELMVGPHYGWQGTSRKCGVLMRVEGDEVCACAMKGSHPQGRETRYIYRVRLSDEGELPPMPGTCSGKGYGGPGSAAYTESILNPDCTVRQAPRAEPKERGK